MTEVVRVAPREFFDEALGEAMQKEKVTISSLAHTYVVKVLVRQIQEGYHPDETLGDRLARALSAGYVERIQLLRDVGDRALVVSGLWWERQFRPLRPSHAAFHLDVGRIAYKSVGGEPYDELAENIGGVVDSLIRLGTDLSLKTARDVLRLYVLWEETRSRHAGRVLAQRGVLVMPSVAKTPS